MTTLADEEGQRFIRALYYGPNGTGKTTDLAAMARLGHVAYLRPDRSVRKRPLEMLGVPVGNIEPMDELNTDAIVTMVRTDFAQRLEENPEALAGVCLDTVTELINRRMEAIVDAEWVKYRRACKSRREEPDPEKRYFVDRDYWQPVTQEMRRIVRHLVDLPCHTAIAAQTREDVDKHSGRTERGPAVNPALSGDLMAYMDFVIRTDTDGFWPDGESVFVGYPRRTEGYHGKDREHVLPARLVDPTFDRVVMYAHGELDKTTDDRQEEYRKLVASRRRRSKRRAAKDDLELEEDD